MFLGCNIAQPKNALFLFIYLFADWDRTERLPSSTQSTLLPIILRLLFTFYFEMGFYYVA